MKKSTRVRFFVMYKRVAERFLQLQEDTSLVDLALAGFCSNLLSLKMGLFRKRDSGCS